MCVCVGCNLSNEYLHTSRQRAAAMLMNSNPMQPVYLYISTLSHHHHHLMCYYCRPLREPNHRIRTYCNYFCVSQWVCVCRNECESMSVCRTHQSPITLAVCNDLGSGGIPSTLGFDHVFDVKSRIHKSPSLNCTFYFIKLLCNVVLFKVHMFEHLYLH
jgi:hypothetical protein